MANPFYTYSGAFIPGTLARAEQVATEYAAVQAGFALLAYQGTDSGIANAYVVTTPGAPTSAYADGQTVQFKAVNANTGPSTINVNGLGVVNLLRSGGSSSQAGDITANTWFTAVYNSVFSAWTIITPVPVTGFTGTISTAPPTNKVGLTAAGGVAQAALPVDVTFAIDQSISPTWTGTHTFSGNVSFNATVSFTGGQALTGLANHYALILNGNSATGQSYGLEINAGTNASDIALLINSQNGGTAYFEVTGAGSVVIGSPTGGAQGVGTINATGLFINGVSVLTSGSTGANPTGTVGLTAVNGSATTFLRSDGAPPLSQAIVPTWTGAHTFTPSSAVTAVTVNAAVNVAGLRINGGTNTSATHYLAELVSGLGSGFAQGVYIQAGTTSGDNAILVVNAANTATYFKVKGDGSGTIGYNGSTGTIIFNAAGAVSVATPAAGNTALSASGAANQFALQVNGNNTSGQSKGLIVIAGTTASDFALAVNNQASTINYFEVRGDGAILGGGPIAGALVDMTPDTGTFTVTYTGMTTTVTGTAVWARIGNIVMLFFPAANGTSNANTFTATGLPSAIQPTRTQQVGVPPLNFTNIGNPVQASVVVNAGSGTVTFNLQGVANNWASASTKGVGSAFTISYLLN